MQCRSSRAVETGRFADGGSVTLRAGNPIVQQERTVASNLLAIFNRVSSKPVIPKTATWKAAALATGLGIAMLAYPGHAAPASGGDTVQGLYDTLLGTMKSGRSLGQSGRFARLEPLIRRTFDIPMMARLSVGSSWVTLSETQRQQVIEGFARYI